MRRCSLLAVAAAVWGVSLGSWGFIGAQQAQPISVDCGRESLQRAVEQAASDAVITVTGTCRENLSVAKNLTLRGPGATLSSPNRYLAVVVVTSGKLFLLGEPGRPLTISGGDSGVWVGSGAVTIQQANITGNGWGVLVSLNGSATVQNSTLSGNGAGISVIGSAEISNNTITNHSGCGVWAAAQTQGWPRNATISGQGNTLSANSLGDLCPSGFSWPSGFRR